MRDYNGQWSLLSFNSNTGGCSGRIEGLMPDSEPFPSFGSFRGCCADLAAAGTGQQEGGRDQHECSVLQVPLHIHPAAHCQAQENIHHYEVQEQVPIPNHAYSISVLLKWAQVGKAMAWSWSFSSSSIMIKMQANQNVNNEGLCFSADSQIYHITTLLASFCVGPSFIWWT